MSHAINIPVPLPGQSLLQHKFEGYFNVIDTEKIGPHHKDWNVVDYAAAKAAIEQASTPVLIPPPAKAAIEQASTLKTRYEAGEALGAGDLRKLAAELGADNTGGKKDLEAAINAKLQA